MNTPKRLNAVLYLDRNRIDFFSLQTPNILTLVFPPDVVSNVDVINFKECRNLIKSFIETNKILPSNITIIASKNILFEKDFPKTDENVTEQVQKFTDNIPFENLYSKVYQLEKSVRISALNKDYFDLVKKTFEENGSIIISAEPIWAMGNEQITQNGLDSNTAHELLMHTESIKGYNFLHAEPTSITTQQNKENFFSNPKNKRAIVLLLVFIILVVVLIVVILTTQPPAKPKATSKPVSIPTLIPTSLPLISPTISTLQIASPSGQKAPPRITP